METLTYHQSKQERVLTYLKNAKLQNRFAYDYMVLFSVKPNDIIKYIERPDDCGRWPMDYVCLVDAAINQISKKYLIEFPEIEAQTEEDRVLSKFLKKNSSLTFGFDSTKIEEVTREHIIAYMTREDLIYKWNADFVLRVQSRVERLKGIML